MPHDSQPHASKAYIKECKLPSVYLPSPIEKHQLLILDPGPLAYYANSTNALYTRPHFDKFLQFIFTNFHVMVWSSEFPKPAKAVCKLFGENESQLLEVWDHRQFELVRTLIPPTVKNLEKVWNRYPQFDLTNTIIIDGNTKKLKLQPYNLVFMPIFNADTESDNVLLKVTNYLLILQQQSNVASFMRRYPFIFPKSWFTVKDPILDTRTMLYFAGQWTPKTLPLQPNSPMQSKPTIVKLEETDDFIPLEDYNAAAAALQSLQPTQATAIDRGRTNMPAPSTDSADSTPTSSPRAQEKRESIQLVQQGKTEVKRVEIDLLKQFPDDMQADIRRIMEERKKAQSAASRPSAISSMPAIKKKIKEKKRHL